MKNNIFDLITYTEEICRKIHFFNSKIKLLICGDFNFGEIYTTSLTYLINSDNNLDELNTYHIIFDHSYKIPKDLLKPSEQTILEYLNYELSSYHEYYDIIIKDINVQEKYNLVKQKINDDLQKCDNSYLFLSKLLIEKTKIKKNDFNEDEMRYLIDKIQENNILENLPWAYYRITKNINNITGYNIMYKDNIVKEVIEEMIDNYFTKINFIEYEQNKPNNIFGYFFEQFLVNKFKNSKKFLNYEIDDILIVNSIYTNNNWEFIKNCEIKSNKCYLIIQDLINAPYYDMAILIPKGNNFDLLLIQITVSKSQNKRELLKIEHNYQRFIKIKNIFENNFSSFKLIDDDFSFLLFEERDIDIVKFCIKNCIKCISYCKDDDIFKYWKDDYTSDTIDQYHIDNFTLINNKNLYLRKEKIKIADDKKLLNLYINPRTKKIKPLINLTQKEREIIKSKIKEYINDKYIININLKFIENENDVNKEPIENEIIVYLKYQNLNYMKIGFGFCANNIIKYYYFNGAEFFQKSGLTHCQKYTFKLSINMTGKKRNNTK